MKNFMKYSLLLFVATCTLSTVAFGMQREGNVEKNVVAQLEQLQQDTIDIIERARRNLNPEDFFDFMHGNMEFIDRHNPDQRN